MEIYRDRLIAYSLGNFLVYKRFNVTGPSGISIVLQAAIDPETGAFRSGRLIPVRLSEQGIPSPDPGGEAIKIIKELTKIDIPNARLQISDDGTIMPIPSKTTTPIGR